jgi:hypothetical protein
MSNQGYLRYKNRLRMHGKYLNVFGECGKVFMRQWRRRKKALGVFSKYAKTCKSVNISENNNTN